MPSVAFATCRERPELTADDARIVPRLPAGIGIVAVPWDDPGRDWGAFDAVVPRSTWDYHLRRAEFESWLDRLDAGGAVVRNPTATIRWNLEKTYLRDLAGDGIATVPTEWLAARATVDLEEVLRRRGWERAVLKPTVAASSWGLLVVERVGASARQGDLDRALGRGGVMIQPLLEEVPRSGEWSIVFFAGAPSHAVIKRGREGEVRVQSDFGGSATAARPPAGLAGWAAEVVAAGGRRGGGEVPLYARVDAVLTAAGPLLMELELIEPQLFLGSVAGAAARFARALAGALEGG